MLENKVAIVTGGSRGIGEAIVELFAQNRAIVVNGDLAVAKEELSKSDGGAHNIKLDVVDKAKVKQAFGRIVAAFGRIDILVNNAGINRNLLGKVEETPAEEWTAIVNVNMRGVMNCIDIALPFMREGKFGRIINMASLAGEIGGVVSSIAYTATKGAILSMTKVIARLEGKNGVTCNSIAPGFIVTEMTRTHNPDMSMVPLGHRGEAVDIANAALYLASDMGRYVTGTTMDVNGGVYMQ
ncbi:MAG: SDR family oxidoreductase [Planctomycetota bacterium]|jgi:3-oxoacyl-[acyl-carrier protein] reductase|nr:SDR family oxidoreductase [Planctomycetota bacterium]